jgi:H+/gluconate symporter-like permease
MGLAGIILALGLLMWLSIALGTMTFTMSALPGTPALQNVIPMPFFGTTPFAAPGIGIVAGAIILTFGLWWLGRAEKAPGRKAMASPWRELSPRVSTIRPCASAPPSRANSIRRSCRTVTTRSRSPRSSRQFFRS